MSAIKREAVTSLNPSLTQRWIPRLSISPFDSINPDSRPLRSFPLISLVVYLFLLSRPYPSHSLRRCYAVLPHSNKNNINKSWTSPIFLIYRVVIIIPFTHWFGVTLKSFQGCTMGNCPHSSKIHDEMDLWLEVRRARSTAHLLSASSTY